MTIRCIVALCITVALVGLYAVSPPAAIALTALASSALYVCFLLAMQNVERDEISRVMDFVEGRASANGQPADRVCAT